VLTTTQPPGQPSSPATALTGIVPPDHREPVSIRAPMRSDLSPGTDDAGLEGEDDGLDTVPQPQFGEDPADV